MVDPGPSRSVCIGYSLYSSGIVQLKLFGLLRSSVEDVSDNPGLRLPLILGLAEGDYYTLCDAFESGMHFSMEGDTYSTFKDFRLIIGCHVESKEDLRFRSVSVRFGGLEAWLNQDPVERSSSEENGKNVSVRPSGFPNL